MQIESELENEKLRIENEAQKQIIKGLNNFFDTSKTEIHRKFNIEMEW